MLCIIPARGGSKRLPNKNILPFFGKPLIAHTIECALQSKSIHKLVLSTDSDQIAGVCANYDIEIPFMRPKFLAKDNTSSRDVFLYTIEKLIKDYNEKIKNFVVLQVTSPLRNFNDIDKAIQIFKDNNADSVLSMTKSNYPLHWAKKITANNQIISCKPEINIQANNPDYYPYIPNGAIYVFNYEYFKLNEDYFSDKSYAYVMPYERSIDIDTYSDLKQTEFFYINSRKNKNE